MEYLLLLLATLTSTGKALVLKKIGNDSGDDVRRMYRLNAGIFGVAATVVLAFALISGRATLPSLPTLLYSCIFASLLVFTQVTEVVAMKHGSASMTILIYSLGLLIPIFYGSIFLSEPISLPQVFGMALIVAALCFIVNPRVDGKFSSVWLIFSLLACFGSGFTAVMQKIQQSSEEREELMAFLVLAFSLAALLSLALSFLPRRGEPAVADGASAEEHRTVWLRTLRFVVFSGVCVGLLNVFNLILAGKLPAVVQFPIYNVGSMILTGVGGRLIFGEKLTRPQLIGFGIGCVAILIVGLL